MLNDEAFNNMQMKTMSNDVFFVRAHLKTEVSDKNHEHVFTQMSERSKSESTPSEPGNHTDQLLSLRPSKSSLFVNKMRD